jgi:Kef-type K+ transport system membrane component KefB
VSSVLQFLLAVITLVAAARLGGLASRRLGQPAVLGELLVGVLLGPSLLDYLHLAWFTDRHLEAEIHHLAELGVIFLMFLAGLEIELRELVKTGRAAAAAGTFGVVTPVALGGGLALLFGFPFIQAIFLGIVLGATSVSISAQTLMELKVLRRRESLALLGAAVFDDVLVILVLALFMALGSGVGGGAASVALVLLRMLGWLAAALLVGHYLLPRLTHWASHLPIGHGLMSFSIVMVLLFAWSAEMFGGVAAITGAFLIGLGFARTPQRHEIGHNFSAITYGFFVPLFFVSIGLTANVRTVTGNALLFGALLIGVAVISKVVGCGLGAWWGGLNRGESLRLGIGMVSRGEVGLIVASIGLSQGLINNTMFAAIVLVVLATTLLTPLMLRWAYGRALPAAVPAQPVADPPGQVPGD